jgi:hypothetical protein
VITARTSACTRVRPRAPPATYSLLIPLLHLQTPECAKLGGYLATKLAPDVRLAALSAIVRAYRQGIPASYIASLLDLDDEAVRCRPRTAADSTEARVCLCVCALAELHSLLGGQRLRGARWQPCQHRKQAAQTRVPGRGGQGRRRGGAAPGQRHHALDPVASPPAVRAWSPAAAALCKPRPCSVVLLPPPCARRGPALSPRCASLFAKDAVVRRACAPSRPGVWTAPAGCVSGWRRSCPVTAPPAPSLLTLL